MDRPFFSIVIPTYNRVSLIELALDSAINQDFDGGYEILVGDDGSTDGTPELIEEKYAGRVRVFKQENAGPGPARNLAVGHASGEYLAFLDSDDAFFPWTLSVYKSLIEQHHQPAILIGQAFDTKDMQASLNMEQSETASRYFENLYESRMAVAQIATDRLTVRRDVFEEVGPFTGEVHNGEDIDFLARAGLAKGYVVIDAPSTFLRRHHPGQVSKEPRGAYEGRMFLLDQEAAGKYPGGKAYRRHRMELLSSWARIASMQMLGMNRADLGMKFYRRVFWWNITLGRWRYLLAYPFMCLKRRK